MHLPGSEWKQNNSFKGFWFTIVRSYFIQQPDMTPWVRPRLHAAQNGDVSLAPPRCKFFSMALLEVAWHECFAKYTKVGEDREGMREEWAEKNEKKITEKTPWNKKSISNICKFVFFPNFLISLLLPIGKVFRVSGFGVCWTIFFLAEHESRDILWMTLAGGLSGKIRKTTSL